jgi:hypothetical protein
VSSGSVGIQSVSMLVGVVSYFNLWLMIVALLCWFFGGLVRQPKLYYEKLFLAPAMEGQGRRRVFSSHECM